uniref:Uncharacterized protein n=1 Tax=Anguilla anguilla TaxID=7936 RepID=A0A0E9XDX9_ANGAN
MSATLSPLHSSSTSGDHAVRFTRTGTWTHWTLLIRIPGYGLVTMPDWGAGCCSGHSWSIATVIGNINIRTLPRIFVLFLSSCLI